MPWRGERAEFEETGVRFPTLGFTIAAWIEQHCVIPDGDLQGHRYVLTDEMLDFLVHFYRVDPNATSEHTGGQRFHHARGGQLVRPQKWGKGPFSGAIICAEAEGPVVPAGWDAAGNPVGRPWQTPLIQVTAISEDQTANVFRALVPMIELGMLSADVPDTGQTRINLTGGGRIEPVTASARSRLGQRITFALQDETHSWTERAGGILLADNQRRNLSGMGGRFLETTNAWDPAELSVAQRTNESPVGVCIDYPTPITGSVRNRQERRKAMRHAYGDSMRKGKRWRPWVDPERIDIEIEALLDRDPAQAERFFLNRVHAAESVVFDPLQWAALETDYQPQPGALITIGVDGARTEDALAIVATEVATFHQWPLCIIERPELAEETYEHDFDYADGMMRDAFERFNVFRVYVDPQNIGALLDRWQGRYGADRVLPWYTNRWRQVGFAVRNYRVAIEQGDLTHGPGELFSRHIANARRMPLNVSDTEGRPLHSIQKDRPHSPRKMDAAMAAVLSAEARSDAIAAGALDAPPAQHWFVGI